MAGAIIISRKELSDHLGSKRYLMLFALILLLSALSAYQGVEYIRNNPDVGFLAIFSGARFGFGFSFLYLMGLFGPILGLALGFDAINKERTSGSLSVLLSYPIFRDSVVNGKFLAGVAALATLVVSTVAIMCGVAIPLLGFGPTLEQMMSIGALTLLTVLYLAFWLSLGLLFSVLAKRTTTSMLASVATWLSFVIVVPILAGLVASWIVPFPFEPRLGSPENVGGENIRGMFQAPEYRELMTSRAQIQANIQRISPANLYSDAASSILGIRQAAIVIGGRQQVSPSISQGIMESWPEILVLLAGMVVCFVVSYVRFLRLEIRPGG